MEEMAYRAEDLPLMLTDENPAYHREMERTQETMNSLELLELGSLCPCSPVREWLASLYLADPA